PHPPTTLFPYTTLFRSPLLRLQVLLEARLLALEHSLHFLLPGTSLLLKRTASSALRQTIMPTLEVLGNMFNLSLLQGLRLRSLRSEEHTSELQSLRHLV